MVGLFCAAFLMAGILKLYKSSFPYFGLDLL
jgi:hypothetical protein